METHNVFGYTRRLRAFSKAHSLQHSHGCCGPALETLTNVISVGPRPILKQHLSGLAGPGHGLQQVLHFVGGAFSLKGGLWYVSYRYHLFSGSDPHYGTVVALLGIHLPQTGEGSPWKSALQERCFLQHSKEFWEIIPHLLVHSSHQTDLSHRPRSVRPVTVGLLHLRVEIGHSGSLDVLLSKNFHFNWS